MELWFIYLWHYFQYFIANNLLKDRLKRNIPYFVENNFNNNSFTINYTYINTFQNCYSIINEFVHTNINAIDMSLFWMHYLLDRLSIYSYFAFYFTKSWLIDWKYKFYFFALWRTVACIHTLCENLWIDTCLKQVIFTL